MRQGFKLIVLVILLAATVAPAAASAGNANFVLGSRTLSNEDYWNPNEHQGLFGATVSFGPESWPVSLSAGSYVSGTEQTVYIGPIPFDLTVVITEFDFGVQKTWAIGTYRPFVGAGISSLGVAARIESGGQGTDDSDQSFGTYLDGGIFWRLGSRFNIGIHVRHMFDTDVQFDFGTPLSAKGDVDYNQAGLILGWGWPAE